MSCSLKRTILFFFVLIIFFSCTGFSLEKRDFLITKKDGSVIIINAEIAVTEEEQQLGFMNRRHIPEGTGMLFLFDKDKIARFWMKNTPSALSIAYIDYKGTIRDIIDMTPFSEAEVVSSVNVRFALEVPQGWFQKNGIKPGDTVKDLPVYAVEMAKKQRP